jgi:NADH dehydrogenase
MSSSHHIVVVGGGVAGLVIAGKLPRTAGRTPSAVTLIDRELAYVYKPMLHAIAAGTSDFSQQETNYIAQARDRHFVFCPGELKGIDRDAQRIRLGPLMIGGRSIVPERTISYDTLILATGSQANDFGTPGVQQYCHMVDSRSQALDLNREIRTRMLESLETSSTLSIAIVGGGATGVELAAELIQLTQIAAYYGASRGGIYRPSPSATSAHLSRSADMAPTVRSENSACSKADSSRGAWPSSAMFCSTAVINRNFTAFGVAV